jgi:hypothetical protein
LGKKYDARFKMVFDAIRWLMAPASEPPRDHLRQSDGWSVYGISDDNCQLMVQIMEAWLISDLVALANLLTPVQLEPNSKAGRC